jgi:succinate dehydrogenase flavin-adding protein (antitoxin of CptAB toxin-antitoxin module)
MRGSDWLLRHRRRKVKSLNWRGTAMADFILQANIARYMKLLATERDGKKIATLRQLLAEEEAKLAEWRAKNSRSSAAG